MDTIDFFRSSLHQCIVKHPRQLLYALYQKGEGGEGVSNSFYKDYFSTIEVWLNALFNWVHSPADLNKMGYVVTDFEDFLSLNESVRIATNQCFQGQNIDSLHHLVRDKLDGKKRLLDDACERAYHVFKHVMSLKEIESLILDMSAFTGSDFLDWIDVVAAYGYLGAFDTHKIHRNCGVMFRDDRVHSLAFRLSSFLCCLDIVKNFMLFYEHCVPEYMSPFYIQLKQHVLRFDELTDRLYMNLFGHQDRMDPILPVTSARTLRVAQRLSDLLAQHQLGDMMIGAAELDNGDLMYGVSGEGSATLEAVNCVDPYLGQEAYAAPVVANTMGYQRIVRISKKGLKTHNGFECVESKLFQGACNRGTSIRSMTILWHGHKPKKRYCVEHADLNHIAKPCPGCLLNLKRYLMIS